MLACAGTAVVAAAPAAAAGSYSPYDESPAAALARYVRTLASAPKDFAALVGAGRAALELGDAQAAAGFFARADEANPRSPLPQAGMGAVSVANGDAQAALPYFARAQQLGAPVAIFGADRGLAYDLLGRQREAQADYRAALGGADSDQARRRLAMSLAIGGNQAGALADARPADGQGRSGRRPLPRLRSRADGRQQRRDGAIDAAMPGSWARVRLSSRNCRRLRPRRRPLRSISACSRTPATAGYAYKRRQGYAAPASAPVASDRLPGMTPIWRPRAPSASSRRRANRLCGRRSRAIGAGAKAAPPAAHKIWLQLASGTNADALPTSSSASSCATAT